MKELPPPSQHVLTANTLQALWKMLLTCSAVAHDSLIWIRENSNRILKMMMNNLRSNVTFFNYCFIFLISFLSKQWYPVLRTLSAFSRRQSALLTSPFHCTQGTWHQNKLIYDFYQLQTLWAHHPPGMPPCRKGKFSHRQAASVALTWVNHSQGTSPGRVKPSPPSLKQEGTLLLRMKLLQHAQTLILMTILCCNVTRYFKERTTLAEATAICASPIRNASKYVFYSNINKM